MANARKPRRTHSEPAGPDVAVPWHGRIARRGDLYEPATVIFPAGTLSMAVLLLYTGANPNATYHVVERNSSAAQISDSGPIEFLHADWGRWVELYSPTYPGAFPRGSSFAVLTVGGDQVMQTRFTVS